MLNALSQETSDPNVNRSSVAIIAPFFANEQSQGTIPWSSTKGSTSNSLVWKNSTWSIGANNQYPGSSTTVSSFEVLDQIVKYYDNQTLFPQMKHIVLAGHGLGAQTIQSYAAIGNVINTRSRITYWIGNPNTYTWMTTSRPIASLVSSCPAYDDWSNGFANFTTISYGLSLVKAGRAAVLARFNSRSKNYARGTDDYGDTSPTCAPYTIGRNRNERFYNFLKAFPPTCPSHTSGQCDTVDYISSGYDQNAMFTSNITLSRLFLDDFYGFGAKAYDAGYPRKQKGDDPYPDPSMKGSGIYTDTTVYGGKMTYQGCWTDDSNMGPSLPILAYDKPSNTINTCTTACAKLGYVVAGLEYGSQCRCGSVMSAYSDKTTDLGCTMACAGNSSQTCGDSSRLSVYASGSLKQNAQPVVPSAVGNYKFYSCMTEASSGRALSASSFSDGAKMTIQACAAFCQDYQYFGLEYSSQCYCGTGFAKGSKTTATSDCAMTCSGNSTQYCGGPNLLSVYKSPNVPPKKSSSSSKTSTLSTATVKAPSTSSALAWNNKCSAPCLAKSCASYTPQVLSYCKAHATGAKTTTVIQKPATKTVTKTITTNIVTVTKAKSKRATAAATCTSAPSVLGGYNCSQISSLCNCLVPLTRTATQTVVKTVATITATFLKVGFFSSPLVYARGVC